MLNFLLVLSGISDKTWELVCDRGFQPDFKVEQ